MSELEDYDPLNPGITAKRGGLKWGEVRFVNSSTPAAEFYDDELPTFVPDIGPQPRGGPTFTEVKHPNAKPIGTPLGQLVDTFGEDAVGRAFVDHMVTEAMRLAMRREEQVAVAAALLGHGYAVVNAYNGDLTYTTHFIISPAIPPLERYTFPSWHAFDLWRERQ